MADLEVSARLVLENAKDLQSQLEATGRAGGAVFGESLNAEAQKRLDTIVANAETAARKVGLAFNRQRLRFEDPAGNVVPDEVFQRLAKLNRGLAQAQRDLGQFAREAENTARDVGGSFDLMDAAVGGLAFSIANTLTQTVIGSAGQMVGALKGLVMQFGQLDTELRKAAAAGGEAGGYDRLAAAVDQVGIEAAGTQLEVAQLATELVRGGMSISQATQSLGAIVRGAEATGTGFAQMGETVSASIKGFGLQAKDAQRVVDALTQGANASASSVTGMGMAFKYSAPVARILGLSVEDLGVAVGLLTNAGIDASEAGVALRNGLSKLASAAPQTGGQMRALSGQAAAAAKVMKSLGLDIYKADGTLKPMETTLLRLKAAFDGLEPSTKIRLAADLFGGEDDGTKWLALLNQSEEDIKKMAAAMANTKGATDTARSAMQGFELKLKQLDGTLGTIGNTFASVTAAALIPVIDVANAVTGAISGLPGPVKTAAAALILMGAALTAARIGLVLFNQALATTQVQAAIAGIRGLGTALRTQFIADVTMARGAWTAFTTSLKTGALAQQVGALAGKFGPLALAIAGVVAAVKSYEASTATASRISQGAAERQNALTEALTKAGIKTGEMTALAGPFARDWQAARISIDGLLQPLRAIPAIGGPVASAVKAIAKAIYYSIPLLSQAVDLWKAYRRAVKAADTRSAIDQAATQVNNLAGETTSAQNAAAKLVAEIEKGGGKATSKQVDQARDYKAALEATVPLLQEQKAELERNAAAAQNSGNKELAAQLLKLAAATEGDIQLSNVRIRQLAKLADAAKGAKGPLQDAAAAEKLRLSLAGISRAEGEARISQLQAAGRLTREQADNERRVLAIKSAQAERGAQIAKLNAIPPAQMKGEAALDARKRVAELDREIADLQIQAAQAEVERRQKVYDLAVGQLQIAQTALDLEGRAAEISAGRLRAQQQVADAQMAFLQAQQGLVESFFGLDTARQQFALQAADTELQRLRDRGAGTQAIRRQEEYIASLKRGAEDIDRRALEAQINGAAQRFDLERRVLQLKQAQQLLEAQSAQRAAAANVLQQQQKLLELQRQLVDPALTGQQRAQVQQQVDLQREAVGLARQQQQAEAGRLGILGTVFGLERETLRAQQQTTANGLRAQAATRGWEQALSGPLSNLDAAAQSAGAVAAGIQQISAGFISAAGQTVQILTTMQEIGSASAAAADAANVLAGGFANANSNAQALLATLQRIATTPQARWAGGDVEPGNRYRINELGQESLLTPGGRLSLISAPANSLWSPPTRGTVLPAGITASLQAAGAFDAGGTARPRAAGRSGSVPGVRPAGGSVGGALLGKLQAAIDRLSMRMDALAAKDWNVSVRMPSNAGLLRAVGGL